MCLLFTQPNVKFIPAPIIPPLSLLCYHSIERKLLAAHIAAIKGSSSSGSTKKGHLTLAPIARIIFIQSRPANLSRWRWRCAVIYV
jgi:hypothetical protein